MADEPDKVKIELEVPKDDFDIRVTEESFESPPAPKKRSPEEAKKRLMEEIEKRGGGERHDHLKKAAKNEHKERQESEIEEKTGFKPDELLKAPAEPPKASDTNAPTSAQRWIMIIGFVLIVVALLAWPLSSYRVALGIALIACAMIAGGTLIRI